MNFLEFKKVLVIITDGRSNSGQVQGSARQLKNSGVVIFSVGIGNSLSMYELQVMASDPANQHVITLGNFSQLAWLAEKMPSQTCNGEFYTHTVLVVVMIKMMVMIILTMLVMVLMMTVMMKAVMLMRVMIMMIVVLMMVVMVLIILVVMMMVVIIMVVIMIAMIMMVLMVTIMI